MTDVTPGQAAHRRWHQVRWPDSTDDAIAKEWGLVLSDKAKSAWEAAAVEHAAPDLAEAMRAAASRELAAAMAESRRYREALEQVARRADDPIAQVRVIAGIARRALGMPS